MGIGELFLIGAGLSMDAFAVSICKGLTMPEMKWRYALLAGMYFGGFQALMPVAGYLLGSQFQEIIANVDHWIAFVLLGIIGINMLREAGGEKEELDGSFDVRTMMLLAVATSIDALAVGVTFAFLKVNIMQAALVIGCTTFAFGTAGVKIGNVFGCRFRAKAEIAGGIILILMGLKILLEHLGIIG